MSGSGRRVRQMPRGWRAGRCLVLLALALLGGGCRERSARNDPALIVGIAVGPTNLDPRVGSDEASQRVHQLLYASLVRLDDQLQVVPEVAERLEARDATTFVAHLRADVRFHDGSPLDAEDVAYTYRSFLDPAFLSPRKGAYAQLAAVDVEDPRTVVFRLKEPFASFPVNLVMGIVPAGTPAGAPARVGAGPYRFVRMQSDDRVELAPFAGYFEGAPRNAGVVLRVIPDDTMRGLELRTGAIDLVINDIAPDIVRTLQRENRMQVVTAPGPGLRLRRHEPARPRAARRARAAGARACGQQRVDHRAPPPRTGDSDHAASFPRCRGRTPRTCGRRPTTRLRQADCSTRPAIRTPTAPARRRACT